MLRWSLPVVVLALSVACRQPPVDARVTPDLASGCWALSPPIFSARGRRVDGRAVSRDTIELRVVHDGLESRPRMRLHGVRGFGDEPVWRDSVWSRPSADSVRILWRYDVNAYELRVRVSEDSLVGQSRYLGDIWPAGWREPQPIAGVRVGCPGRATR